MSGVGALQPSVVYQRYARNTWLYLRLAMVGVVLTLGAAVVIEHVKVGSGCFQPSISAYYYTPVRGVFIGALATLGVCLICLRGSTGLEDLLLNVAGMLAPIVAFVPTSGYIRSCTSAPRHMAHMSTAQLSANVANNVVALLIVAGMALLIVGCVLVLRDATWLARVGGLIGAVLWVSTLVVFLAARHAFVHNAHGVAAMLFVACVVAAAVDNAFDTKKGRPLTVLYIALAVAMAGPALIIWVIGLAANWHHWQIVAETVVLVFFVVFWLTQTVELREHGIRRRSEGKRQLPPSKRMFGSPRI